MTDKCPRCGCHALRVDGAMVICEECRHQLRDVYGRTEEERQAARLQFKSYGPKAAANRVDPDAAERDRIARRLLDW